MKRILNFLAISPLGILFYVWFVIFLIFEIKLVDYSITSSTITVIALFFLAFSLGYSILGPGFVNKSIKLRGQNWLLKNNVRLVSLYKIFNLLAIVGVLLALATVISKYGINRYLTDQSTIKGDPNRSVIAAYLIVFGYINITIGIVLYNFYNPKKRYLLVPIGLIIAYSCSFWGRHPIANALIQLLFSYFIVKGMILPQKIHMKRFLSYILGTVTLIVIAFLILSWSIKLRLNEFDGAYDPFINEERVDWIFNISPVFGGYSAMQISYAYLGASVPTLDYWLSADSEYLMGQASFPYLYRIFTALGAWDEEIVRGDRALGGLMQLPGLIGYIYMDFGIIGIVFSAFIIGYICKYLFIKALALDIFGIMLLPQFYILLINSPLISATAHSVYFYTVIVSLLISYKLKFTK